MDTDTRPLRKKAPRRTAERIVDVALDLFNRRGEPHVSTQMLAAELHISPGNLHYHFATKAALVNALYDQFEAEHAVLLAATPCTDEPALLDWLMALHRLMWNHRFLFRDTCDLLTRNRHVETHLPAALNRQHEALVQRLGKLATRAGDASALQTVATAMHLALNHWVGHEYLCDPRHGLENDQTDAVAARVRAQLAGLLAL